MKEAISRCGNCKGTEREPRVRIEATEGHCRPKLWESRKPSKVEDTEQKKTKRGKNGRKQSSHKDFPWDRHAESRTKWQCPGGASAPKTKQNSFS